jgi:hypothetical protein
VGRKALPTQAVAKVSNAFLSTILHHHLIWVSTLPNQDAIPDNAMEYPFSIAWHV